jgi:hypothetical protein
MCWNSHHKILVNHFVILHPKKHHQKQIVDFDQFPSASTIFLICKFFCNYDKKWKFVVVRMRSLRMKFMKPSCGTLSTSEGKGR